MIKNFTALFFLFFLLTAFLCAQASSPPGSEVSGAQRIRQRIVWRGGEHALRYNVIIERSEDGTFRNHFNEFTTELYIDVSLVPGEYRFRVIPHDILDRPSQGTEWRYFRVREAVVPIISETQEHTPQVDSVVTVPSETDGAVTESVPVDIPAEIPQESGAEQEQTEAAVGRGAARFNTIGISLGTSFVDPLLIAGIHGTYAPINFLFIEGGFDFGFISKYTEVYSFYCIYPYMNLGFFMPFRNKAGFFISAGGGYMFGNYKFPAREVSISVFSLNAIAGVILSDFLNISYTFRTDFKEASHKTALGYVYRFRQK